MSHITDSSLFGLTEILGLVLLLLLLQMTIGLHCSLTLLFHDSLSGHGGLGHGGRCVSKKRVEEQVFGRILKMETKKINRVN